MTRDVLRSQFLSQFTCLGDKCEDTCCQNWSMQMDMATLARYRAQAPQLLDAVVTEPDGTAIMKKNPQTGFCVKLENGLCGIHRTHGDSFLGDACYFYPRVTRALGEQVVMTATLSCPEIARLALFDAQHPTLENAQAARMPHGLKNYLPQELSAEEALQIHQCFLDAANDAQASAEQIFLRINNAGRSLMRISAKEWPRAAAFYLRHADGRVPPAQAHAADPFNVLHALCGLIAASKKTVSPRLQETIGDMEKILQATLDWKTVAIHTAPQSSTAYRQLKMLWDKECAARYAPLLRRWLQMQLALALFPFAGLGNTLAERATLIGVRLATIKLALMCACSIYGPDLPQDTVVRVVQSLSRFLDHLGDAAFSLQVYTEAGWTQESRLRGLLEV